MAFKMTLRSLNPEIPASLTPRNAVDRSQQIIHFGTTYSVCLQTQPALLT